jgi:hypothetical protein
VSWDTIACSPLKISRRFGVTFRLHLLIRMEIVEMGKCFCWLLLGEVAEIMYMKPKSKCILFYVVAKLRFIVYKNDTT